MATRKTKTEEKRSGERSTRRRVLPWVALLLVATVLVALWAVLPLGEWLAAIEATVEGLGALGYLLFAGVYVVGTVLLAPGSVLTLAAGLAFGLWGIPLVVIAATTGAALAFLVGRYLALHRVMKLVEERPTLKAADAAIAEEGWKVVLLMRLSPLVPFNLQNYFFGVTNVGFWPYVVATLVGIIPGTAVYVAVGAAGKAASGGGFGAAQWSLIAVGLIATIFVTVLVTKKARAKLAAAGVGKPETG